MSVGRRARGRIAALALTCVTVLASGCGSGLANLPLPAPNVSGTSYSLSAVFASALNLPAKAKVKFNGADIGEVEGITAHDFTAVVRMRIRADAPIRAEATAELRSATPLGDLFVAIHPAKSSSADARPLHDGDVIPMASTSAAATVEELLSSVALLVNGGAVRQLVNVLNGGGVAVGGRGEKLNALIEQSSGLISRLTARSAQLDRALRGTSDLAAELAARQGDLTSALNAAAPATAAIADNSARIADLTAEASRIAVQLDRFPSLQGTDSRSMIKDLNNLAASFNEAAIDPNLSINSLNRLVGILAKTTNSTAAHANVDVRKIALGWLPDKNYPGDPGMHFPDGTDFHSAVGSLRYEWNVLLDRIYGARR